MKKLIDDALSDAGDSDEMIQDTAVDDLVEPELGVEQKVSKKDDTRKASDRNQSGNRGPAKRSRTGAITVAILCSHSLSSTYYPSHMSHPPCTFTFTPQ